MPIFGDNLRLEESNKEISQILLDIYSEKTGLPVALYWGNENFIWSGKYWSDFCKKIRKIMPDIGCDEEYLAQCKKSGPPLRRCFAGLWGYYQPIKVESKEIATLITGQTRIRNRDKQSRKILENLLNSYNVRDSDRKEVTQLYENIKIINEEDFDTDLLAHLSEIERYIVLENQRINLIKKLNINVAHEFSLPIQSIIGIAENLYEQTDDPVLKNKAEDIIQEMTKLHYFTENIKGTRYTGFEEEKLDFSENSLYKPLIESIRLFRKEANKKNVAIKTPVSKIIDFPFIEMSPPHIRRIFFNLMHNAVKYSYKTSKVSSKRYIDIIGYPKGEYYCIEISNFGVGIKAIEITEEKIFQEGYRGELAIDMSRTGSGIGLSMVKRLVENHNGSIKIKSNPETDSETGPYKTTVILSLPFTQKKGGK